MEVHYDDESLFPDRVLTLLFSYPITGRILLNQLRTPSLLFLSYLLCIQLLFKYTRIFELRFGPLLSDNWVRLPCHYRYGSLLESEAPGMKG